MWKRGLAGAAVIVVSGCAGTDAPSVEGPPLDPGHGGVEQIMQALKLKGVPCPTTKTVPLLPGTEQAVECSFGATDETVLLVHFFDATGAAAFEAETRRLGKHGVFAKTWAARTESAQAAALMAKAVQADSHT